MISFRSSMSCGDVIYSLPFIRHIHRKTGQKCTLYLEQSPHANYDTYRSLKRLFECGVDYVDLKEYKGQSIHYDLNKVREAGNLRKVKHWENYFNVFSEGFSDDSFDPWLSLAIPEKVEIPKGDDDLPINLFHITGRYTNHGVDFETLIESVDGQKWFCGFPEEWADWQHIPNLTYFPYFDLLEVAFDIIKADAFYCNQSAGLVLAQALGHENINLAVSKGFTSVYGLRNEKLL